MRVLTEQIFVGLAEISMCIRMTNFVYHFDEASNFLITIKSFKLRNQQEYDIFKKRLALFSTIMKFYLTCASFAITFSCVAPMFDDKLRLPYPGWSICDWRSNMTCYYMQYTYQFVGVIFLAHTLVRLENYQIYCMICAAAKLEILAMRSCKIGYNKNNKLTDQQRDSENLALLLENIKTHKFVMKYVADVERVFSIPFLFQLFCSSAIFCLTGFQLIIMENGSDDNLLLAYYFSFSCTMLNEIFLPCYFGTILTSTNESVSKAIYSSNWPDLSQSFKNTMIIFVEQLQRPRIMKSGKIFTLSLISFLTVINRSYSMFAVLRSLIK
ncbi:putative odorant receptor 71a [Bradysia coprophila]|uniref:putative odorant receptor 71a n=1 Tax=Bradysia coprophila TaxID=38358 RepID=UPI00187DACA8|nr:putative odorant receptor 71a [Bradysia coprophila]